MLFIFLLSEEGIAKLASTFQLFIFMLINFSVIVFRKSKIQSYDPGYKSPLYPGMQIAGILISFVMIIYMGWMAILFSLSIVLVSVLWYHYDVRIHLKRDVAFFDLFALLGPHPYDCLYDEF